MIMKRTSLLFASCALALAAAAVPARPVITFQDENGTTHTVSETSNGIIEIPGSEKSGNVVTYNQYITVSSEGASQIEYEYNYFGGMFNPKYESAAETVSAPFTKRVTDGSGESNKTDFIGGRTYTIYGIDEDGNKSEPLTFFMRVVGTTAKDKVTSDDFNLPVAGTYYSVDSKLNTAHNINSHAVVAQNEAGEFMLTDDENVKSGFVVTKNNSEYVIKKITIEWGSDAVVEESGVEIYGKKLEEYTSAADLYDEEAQGQHLATIYRTGATDVVTFDVNSECDFIGLRAINGDVSIKSITAVWTYSIPAEPELVGGFPDKLTAGTVLTWKLNGYGALYYALENGTASGNWDYVMDSEKSTIKEVSYTVPEDQSEATFNIYSYNVDTAWNNMCIKYAYHYSIGSNGNVSGVEDIDADNDVEAEYYNLQGVRVAADELTPGLYIRRQGTSVTKVAIR